MRTLENRSKFRITFPNIVEYRFKIPEVVFELDPDKLEKFEVVSGKSPTFTTEETVTGQVREKHNDTSYNSVVYQIAKKASELLIERKSEVKKGEINAIWGNRLIFASMVNCVKTALKSNKIQYKNHAQLATSPNLENIASHISMACVDGQTQDSLTPVFADEKSPGQPRILDTSAVDFNTRHKNRYPKSDTVCKKSEINIAACDSEPEVVMAGILDAHEEIASWMRNFNLDWVIPYTDPKSGRHRYYEPDFVARLTGDDLRYLILEYKGQADSDAIAKKEAVEKYWLHAVNRSNDDACNGLWDYVMVENEPNPRQMKAKVDEAIELLRGQKIGD